MDRTAIKTALNDMFPHTAPHPNAPEFVIEEMNGLLQRNHGEAVMHAVVPLFFAKPHPSIADTLAASWAAGHPAQPA